MGFERDIDQTLVRVPGMCGGHGSGEVDPLDCSGLGCVDLDRLTVLNVGWCLIDEGARSTEEIGRVVELEAELSAWNGVGFWVRPCGEDTPVGEEECDGVVHAGHGRFGGE